MARRLHVRKADLAAAQAGAAAFMQQGLKPSAVDISPDGKLRFRFGADVEDDLDREFREWQDSHG